MLSLYEVFQKDGREVMRLISQRYIDNEETVKLYLYRAKIATLEAIDKGKYDYRQEVYQHPLNARKPYLDKYLC